ncbi:peptide/nickel transport system ATP-binding protein [Halogranum amylolyticum]|uniref:Peptide/nickel transport system ATP-binding protein n=1 Tax=Halogranum amylolyticum TaxID=660520 RepID=A0A1H8RJ55_9EURY|nr:oligopeptide/dipeptide ABC transporter ATP-binding protein [Halogranum amylolyticum]SEO66376.1 peptide/nickel transport system ATP-binding protein [Halogranum amylolyticum]
MTSSEPPVLSVRDLKKYYFEQDSLLDSVLRRETQSVKAVDGISFDIQRGETLGLVGESGCGKSTTGETLLRLREATAGSVEFDGEDVLGMSSRELKAFRRRAQIVFQDPFSSLDPRMTVGDILAEPLKIHGLPAEVPDGRSKREVRREKAQEYLERVGLSAGQIDRYPHEFSGGQRQRIGIARALMLDPEFVVLDEPVSALDVSVQAQVLNLLDDLQEEFGLTYLFIAHDLSVVRHICDRVAVMYLGNVVELGPTDELFDEPRHPYTQALLESVPRAAVEEQGRRVDPLPGDVPSPRNPPSGCRFRTRCPQVIPPDDVVIDQSTYREVMDLRDRIESGDLNLDNVWDDVDENRSDKPAFKRRLRAEFFAERLSGENEAVVERALDALAEDDRERAAALLRDRFASVCERVRPVLQQESHPVACHLYEQPETTEPPVETSADD